jgi:hypothetical protein
MEPVVSSSCEPADRPSDVPGPWKLSRPTPSIRLLKSRILGRFQKVTR